MKVVPMSKDGNCLFNAVAFSISQHFLHGTGEYYSYLGIKSTSDVDLISQRPSPVNTRGSSLHSSFWYFFQCFIIAGNSLSFTQQ